MQSVVYDSTLQLFMNKGGTQTQVYVCCKRNKEGIGKKKVENKEEQEGDFIIRKSLFLIIYESLSLIISKRQCLII